MTTKSDAYLAVLAQLAAHLPPDQAEGALRHALRRCSLSPASAGWDRMAEVVEILAIHINKLLGPGHQLLPDLKDLVLRHAPAGARHELRFDLRSIDDLVRGRRSAQQLSMRLGARGRIALAVATAVSEIGRIILAHSGSAAFCIDRLTGPRAGVLISATGSAREGGAPPRGQTHLPRDQELAILVARRLMDEFSIETSPDGSVTLTVVKYFDTARRDQR